MKQPAGHARCAPPGACTRHRGRSPGAITLRCAQLEASRLLHAAAFAPRPSTIGCVGPARLWRAHRRRALDWRRAKPPTSAVLPRPQTQRARICGPRARPLRSACSAPARRAARYAAQLRARSVSTAVSSASSRQCAGHVAVGAANDGRGGCSGGGRAAGPAVAAASRHKPASVPARHNREAGGAAVCGQPLL